MNLSEDFWDDKYINKNTGWDIGHVSTPLKHYFDQLTVKNLKILVPGSGNKEEYLEYFTPYFKIKHLEPCYNSIQKRTGQELFFLFLKN